MQSVKSRIWVIRRTLIIVNLIEGPVLASKVKSRWPAIILAARRTARVPGRIIFLIVSISTINGISSPGVPWGTRWANMCWVLLIQPNNINAIHSGKESDRVIVKCLELVKIYGKSPSLLLNTIKENKVVKIIVLPVE